MYIDMMHNIDDVIVSVFLSVLVRLPVYTCAILTRLHVYASLNSTQSSTGQYCDLSHVSLVYG